MTESLFSPYTIKSTNIQPTNSIVFNTKDTKEIVKFTENGFYYKGQFIEDAGEVYRLLKETLYKIQQDKWKDLCEELVNDLAWWLEGDCKPSDYPDNEEASFQLIKRVEGELKLEAS